jgi:alcohol dehydrogenase
VWFTAPRTAELREEVIPAPGSGEIVVRGLLSLVSPGTEMNIYRGQSTPSELGNPTTRGTLPFPIKYGYQVVGEIVEAGRDSRYAVGDRVFCRHPHQDHFVITVGQPDNPLVSAIPPDLDLRRAVFVNMCSTAYNALLDVSVRPGDVVVVAGLGMIGQLVAHLVRPTAGQLIVVDPLAQRRERAGWLGADAVVDPGDAPAAIHELAKGRGADVYFEASGGRGALQAAIDGTGVEGTIGVVAYYGSREVTLRLAPEFLIRRQRIVGSFVGMVGSGLQPRWTAERRTQEVMKRLATIDTSVLVTHTMSFDDAALAYEMIDSRPEEALGVLLDYGHPS